MAKNAKNNLFLFCNLPSRNKTLDKYLDPILELLSEETQTLLAPTGVMRGFFDRPFREVLHHFWCKRAHTTRDYEPVRFVLSDRRPGTPHPYGDIYAGNPSLPWASTAVGDKSEPMWRHPWDIVTVTEREPKHGVTLWESLGNGCFQWTHLDMTGRVTQGGGSNSWDAEGKHLYLIRGRRY